jgi:hypothetical protein
MEYGIENLGHTECHGIVMEVLQISGQVYKTIFSKEFVLKFEEREYSCKEYSVYPIFKWKVCFFFASENFCSKP